MRRTPRRRETKLTRGSRKPEKMRGRRHCTPDHDAVAGCRASSRLRPCDPREFVRRSVRACAVDSGLDRVEPSDDVLVAFAAMDATRAVSGSRPHSPFAEAPLANLATPGLEEIW